MAMINNLLKSKVNRAIIVYILIMLYIIYTKPDFIFSEDVQNGEGDGIGEVNTLMFGIVAIMIAVIIFFFSVIQ